MYNVYAIVSNKDKRIYIGIVKDVEARLKEHNKGKTKSTKYYRPWTLFYSESAESRLLARQREKELKSGVGREFLKEKLEGPCSS